ncbi:MAG: efflux RND transporter permease subunit [Planctomycetota bacterium]|nr:MAG: efflux RND transporter permease subunit [Planctomycetota bacterium]
MGGTPGRRGGTGAVSGLLDACVRFSVRRRPVVLVAALLLVALGVQAVRRARLDALPGFTPPRVVVQTEAPGLGPQEVETRVSAPLERLLLGTPGVETVRSSSSAGLSVIELWFVDGTDVYRARQLVSERLSLVGDRLPPGVEPPRIAPISAPVGALLRFCLTPADTGSPRALDAVFDFARYRLRPRLLAVRGVSQVTVHGGAPARVEVRPRVEALLRHGLDLEALERAVRAARDVGPVARLVQGEVRAAVRVRDRWFVAGAPSPAGHADGGERGKTAAVSGDASGSDSTAGALAALRSAVVARRGGVAVRLADVAEVRMGRALPVGRALYDGRAAVYVQVDKLPSADTLRVSREVERVLRELDRELPSGARRQPPTYRQADLVRASIGALGRAALVGGALVVVVLLSVLGSWRLAAISLAAIPLSLLAAFAVLVGAGVTIDAMTLGGLAIAVGEVVDDAIVDVESIWRRLRDNARAGAARPVEEVVRTASLAVRGGVVFATFVSVALLVPVLLLGGLVGRIFAPLAASYILAMLASLGVALFVTPALSLWLLPSAAERKVEESRLAGVLRRGYEAVLARVARRPGRVLAASAVLLGMGLAALPFLGGGYLPEFREGVLIGEVETWPGTSLAEATRIARRLTRALGVPLAGDSLPPVPHVAARVGRAPLDEDAAPVHRIEMDIVLPRGEYEPEEAALALARRLARVPGVRFQLDGVLGERINELLSGERAPIAVRLRGASIDALRQAAGDVARVLRGVPELTRVRAPARVGAPVFELSLRSDRLARHGIASLEVLEALRVGSPGREVTRVRGPGGSSIPVVIAGSPVDRDDPQRLLDRPIWTRAGAVLPLSALARVRERETPDVIRHVGGQRVVFVTAQVRGRNLAQAEREVRAALRTRVALPPGVHVEVLGRAKARREAAGRLVATGLPVLLAVGLLFVWALGSFADAAVALSSLPLGVVGGVLLAALLPDGVSVAGMVGFVTLLGIVSRNGLLLVERILERARGEPGGGVSQTAVLQAARERMLPIVMTAATAFFGLLPFALSFETAGSELEAAMAAIVCAGLLTSTTLNLVVVPACYLWRARRRAARGARARGGDAED